VTTFYLGGGCYWCLDAAYRVLRGVSSVVSGFAGGHVPLPSYDAVCTGSTGHAEIVEVTFDESVIPADVILDAFFTMHDPRQLNRQGNDVGSQYRSVMFPTDANQRALFDTARERANDHWDGGVVTEIVDFTEFFPADDYHQDFFAKNPTQGYCLAVAVPKVNKVRAGFAQYITA
jgi:peptide-methionine (S)-S-oxide reductase